MKSKASDIHLLGGAVPALRIKGDLVNIKCPSLSEKDLIDICNMIIQEPKVRERLAEVKDYDGSFDVKNLARFRINVLKTQGRVGIIMRVVPYGVPSIDGLGLPPVMKKVAAMSRGLVLVTGITGSGKSSTLAAIIDHINATSAVHILTIEDPIEFIHPSKMARVIQREVGRDTETFSQSLRAALRQDPDVILVGEMRDQETIDTAIKAAETGHLVLSTVHTTDAIKTIGRLVSVFPPEEQRAVRLRLADNIAATISQRLIPRADGKGMIACQEIMLNNGGIAECISNPDLTGQMNDYIEKSFQADGTGGRTFEQHLAQLYLAKTITLEKAKEYASNPSDFERNILYGRGAGDTPQLGAGVQLDRDEAEPKPEEAA